MLKDWGFVAALALARMAFGFQFQSVASLGPELTARFGLEYAALGTLIGLFMLPGVFVALPGGLLGRRFGARALVGVGLGLMTLGGVVGAVAFTPAGLAAGRLVAGVGAVTLVVMQGKMVSDRFTGKQFMPIMGLLIGAFPVGVGLVGLLQAPLVAKFGPFAVLLVGAGIAALSLLLFLPTVGRSSGSSGRWTLPSWRESRLVLTAGAIWTAYNAGYYGFLSYMPSLLAARGHPPAMTATVMTIATWANLPATILGGILAVRYGNGPVLIGGTIAGVAAVGGPAVFDMPLLWGTLFGTAASLHAGVIVALGTLSARPENRASAMGLFYTAYYLGGAIFPGVCGWAADRAGSPAGALVAAAIIAAAAIPFYLFHQWLDRRA